MPTYEYACKDCGSHLEVVQSFSDDPLTECPTCSGSLRKVFGSIGITFKGSGFYKTDSRSTSSSPKSADGAGEGSSDTSKDTSDTKKDGTDTPKKETKKAEPAAASSGSGGSGSGSGSSSGAASTA